MILLVLRNSMKKSMHNKIQSTNGISGLAYLEYWIHKGIEDRDNREIYAHFLFEIFTVIKYKTNKQIKEESILGNLIDNSLFPNNLIANAVSQ